VDSLLIALVTVHLLSKIIVLELNMETIKKRHTCAICGSKRYSIYMEVTGISLTNGEMFVCKPFNGSCSFHPDIKILKSIQDLSSQLSVLKGHLKNLK